VRRVLWGINFLEVHALLKISWDRQLENRQKSNFENDTTIKSILSSSPSFCESVAMARGLDRFPVADWSK
jgi:hypothetical protein